MKPHQGGQPPRRRPAPPRRGAGHAPPRKGAAGFGGPGGRYRPPVAEEGVSPFTVMLFVIALGLAAMMVIVMIPRKLDFIKGYPAKLSTEAPRNLQTEMQQIAFSKNASDVKPLTFSEAEINAYVNKRIKGKQDGPLSLFVKYQGAYVDLEPDIAEIYVERSVAGLPFTMSLQVKLTTYESKKVWKAGGGSIGKFRVSSRQFKPIVDSFLNLGKACGEEVEVIKMLPEVRFEHDQMTLAPVLGG
ncbi:MAG: hypothetical protein KDM91_19345 [Verrucomicrobiae bacterium]|nr:hypothetical protein [Verrucomicrobiae bacterium]MCP5550158.1 hypothetical protein [Akkermansiaceae bacterium]